MGEKLSIGQTLRKQREERGLTPEQAAYQSKVPLRLLQALEADDYRLLPDPGYLIRLLHEYALLLKLDVKALEAEFRTAIRRPPGPSLVPVPSQPPPTPIPWRQVLWSAAAILIITPLVFIALSLASKRAAERPAPPRVAERLIEEQAPVEGEGTGGPEQPFTVRPGSTQPEVTVSSREAPALLQKASQSAGPIQGSPTPAPPSSPAERRPPRFLLTARALEPTWMTVRAGEGQERDVLLQKGQTARFVSDTGFVVTVGNAGGVELSLNGNPLPSLGASGQVIRSLAIPLPIREPETLGAAAPGTSASGVAPPPVVPAAPQR